MTFQATPARLAAAPPRATSGAELSIGGAAAASGVSAKMIRYYESIGLLRPIARSAANYRTYGPDAVATLRFIGRARSLGFSMDEIAALLALWRDKGRSSADVKALATRHAEALEQRIRALREMQRALDRLVRHCHGDERPQCPILDELSGDAASDGSR